MNLNPGAESDEQRRLRHTVEDDQARHKADLAAAVARTPGEWFDIFTAISFPMVKREMERVGMVDPGAYEAKMAEHIPFYQKVRAILNAHGLPLNEEVEFEGPQVERDVLGQMHNVTWPRGAWIELHWPGNKSEMLRFEGRCASVALEFILWWDGFHQLAMHMDGKDATEKARVVDPNSADYRRYISGKKEALGE